MYIYICIISPSNSAALVSALLKQAVVYPPLVLSFAPGGAILQEHFGSGTSLEVAIADGNP
jgi:hypothetical protein